MSVRSRQVRVLLISCRSCSSSSAGCAPTHTSFAVLDLVGSTVRALDAWHGHQWGFLLLEGTWAVVSAYALVRRAPVAAAH